jgi:hypothetical protein
MSIGANRMFPIDRRRVSGLAAAGVAAVISSAAKAAQTQRFR